VNINAGWNAVAYVPAPKAPLPLAPSADTALGGGLAVGGTEDVVGGTVIVGDGLEGPLLDAALEIGAGEVGAEQLNNTIAADPRMVNRRSTIARTQFPSVGR